MKKILSLIAALILPAALVVAFAPAAKADLAAQGYTVVKGDFQAKNGRDCSTYSGGNLLATTVSYGKGNQNNWCRYWMKQPAKPVTSACAPPKIWGNSKGNRRCLTKSQIAVINKQRIIQQGHPPEEDPPPASSDEPAPSAIINKVSSPVLPPTDDPNGNIIITTCLKSDTAASRCDKDHRLGKVRVKVERIDGAENCINKTKKAGLTNQQTTIKRNGKDVTVKGTIHYIGCNTGKYRVSVVDASLKDSRVGRKGYRLVAGSHNPKEFTLSDNENQHLFFVLEKGTVKASDNSVGGASAN